MSLLQRVKDALDNINYKPYNFSNTLVTYGLPPVKISELDFVRFVPNAKKTKFIKSLTGGGVFADSKNMSGQILLGVPQNTKSSAALELLQLAGAAFPVAVIDTSSGGTSSIISPAARITETLTWERKNKPSVITAVIECPIVVVTGGMRLEE